MKVLSLYQPRASDMRTMATVLKCITYLERVAKYSKNISSAVRKLDGDVPNEFIEDVVSMGNIAVNMVNKAIDGFIQRSVDGFDEIQDMDELKEMVEYIYKTRIRPEHALTSDIYLFDCQEQTLSKLDDVQEQDMGMTQQM